MYSLHALMHAWVLFSDILGQVLQDLLFFLGLFVPDGDTVPARELAVFPRLQQQSPVILDGA